MMSLQTFLMTTALALGQPVDVTLVVEQALDQPANLEFNETAIPVVAQTIAEQSGVEVRISPEIMSLLPYGQDTTINATMKDLPLREALNRLLSHLGMTYYVEGRGVTVVPTEAMERIGRRVNWNELATLGWLSEVRWSQRREELDELQNRLQFKVETSQPWESLKSAIDRVGAGVGADVLTQACESLGWTWYASNEEIVILSREDEIQRRLGRMVNVRANGRPLWDVLQEIGGQVGVSIGEEPGTVSGLSPQFRDRFSLIAEGGSAQQVLQTIAASTGLGIRTTANGVVFYSPDSANAAAGSSTTSSSGNLVRAKVTVFSEGGQTIDILLRDSDLSPEARLMLDQYTREAAQTLEAELKKAQDSD